MFPRKGVRNKDGSRKKTEEQVVPREPESERGAARRQVADPSFRYLKGLHRQMAGDAISRIIQNPFASFLNCLMIGVAFALPAMLYLLVGNLQILGNSWEGQPRVSLYLDSGLTQSQINRLRIEVRDDPGVKSFRYVSPDDGLKSFQEKAQMKGVVDALGFNPLPGIIEIEPYGSSAERLNEVVVKYQNKAGVAEARLDQEWVERLHSMVSLLDRFALLLSILLGIIVLLTVGNTVRLSVENRRSEIRVIKLVGGTDGFITLPFLYMGMWYGLGGALLSLIIVWAVLAGVMSGVLELAGLYGSSFTPKGPGFAMMLSLLVSGIILGVLGAAASCFRHLRTIEQGD